MLDIYVIRLSTFLEIVILIVERKFDKNCLNIEYLIEPTLIIVGTIFIAIRNCSRVALRKKICTSKLREVHGRVWCNKIAHSDET